MILRVFVVVLDLVDVLSLVASLNRGHKRVCVFAARTLDNIRWGAPLRQKPLNQVQLVLSPSPKHSIPLYRTGGVCAEV